jgi:hypothetical protein
MEFWCPETSKFKLKILFKDEKQATFYSRLKVDKANEEQSKNLLVYKFLKSAKSFRGKYLSAILIENKTGVVLQQFNADGVPVKITNPILQ